MPTTSAGKTYTYRQFLTSDGQQNHWYMDDNRLGDVEIPMLFFIHGSGGTGSSFQQEHWLILREWLIDSGWVVLEGMGNSTSNFGGPAARAAYLEAFNYVESQINVGKITMLGQSMGGLFSYWATTLGPFAHRVKSLALHAGLTDLMLRYDEGQEQNTHFNRLYGVEPADVRDVEQFFEKTTGYDPMRFPESVWAGKRVLQMVGTNDTSVVPADHGLAWVAKYGDSTAELTVVERPQAHGVTPGNINDILDFIAPAPAPAPESPTKRWGGAFLLDNFYLVGSGDELLRLTPPQ